MTENHAILDASSRSQNNTGQKARRSRFALLVLCIFVGAGALFGGGMSFIAPDFMAAPMLVPILQEIPMVGPHITSLAIPATALLLLIFVPHLIAVILMLKKHSRQFLGAIICGIFLVAFTAGEMLFMPNLVSILFLLFGIVEIVLALICQRSNILQN